MLNFMLLNGQRAPRPIEGLVYHLKLDGTPGTEQDSIRNVPVLKHYGNVTKSTDVPSARFKGSYYFDGSSWVQSKCDDFLYNNLLQSPTYSISYWFKQYGKSPSGVGHQNNHMGIGYAHDTPGLHQQLTHLSSNGTQYGAKKMRWEVDSSTANNIPERNLLTNECVEFNNWYHVALTFSFASGGKIYINNRCVEQAGASTKGEKWDSTANNLIRIGRTAFYDIYTWNSWGWGEPFYGCICDFRVYNTELQPAEIAALYANAA